MCAAINCTSQVAYLFAYGWYWPGLAEFFQVSASEAYEATLLTQSK